MSSSNVRFSPFCSISSSSGLFSVFSSGNLNSSIAPAVGPSWATLPASGMHSSGSSVRGT